MLIDPLKQVNKKVDVNKLNNRMDKIVNEVIEFLIEELFCFSTMNMSFQLLLASTVFG